MRIFLAYLSKFLNPTLNNSASTYKNTYLPAVLNPYLLDTAISYLPGAKTLISVGLGVDTMADLL